MIARFFGELALRLFAYAAPKPQPVVRPVITARNQRRLEAKSYGRGPAKRG